VLAVVQIVGGAFAFKDDDLEALALIPERLILVEDEIETERGRSTP